MPYPVAVVEIAFTDGPYVVSPTWTDVTAYVRGMDISRGIPDDWTLQADGSATVTLSNRDRRFDPFNTTGPYYGNLLPRRQIRIRATHLGTTYDVFRGFIAGWPPEWTDAGTDSTVTLFCFDALQLLGSSSLPADWAEDYILSLSPRHYWKLDEPIPSFNASTVTFTDNGSSPLDLIGKANIIEAGPELAPGLPSKSVQGLALPIAETGSGTAVGSVSNLTASMWILPLGKDNYPGASFVWGGRTLNIFYGNFDTGISSGDYTLFVVEYYVGSTVYQWRSTENFSINEAHHVAFAVDASTGNGTLYIDGINRTGTRTSFSTAPLSPVEYYSISDAAFQQVCVFPSILTQTQIQTIIQHSQAQIPETTSARFNRLIAKTPFNAFLTSAPASPASSVLDITPDAATAVSELGKVAASEYAPLFVNKAGTLTLYSQSQIRSQTDSIVPQAEYGNGVGFMGNSIGTEVQLQYDGDSMRNVSNVQMSGGGVYIQTNSSSVTTYGEAEQYVETQVASLADAVDIANIVNGWGGQVYAKASPVSVVLSPTASWASTLGLELFDRFTLQVTPPSGNAITTPMLASRIAHSVSPERWVTTLEGSARWAAVFILNQSRLGGTDLLG